MNKNGRGIPEGVLIDILVIFWIPGLLERRIIFDYKKYGDSPNCIGEISDLAGQIGLTQGFGITESLNDGSGKLLETNVTIISNEECYEKLNNIIINKSDGYSQRHSIKQSLYEGVTDQILCTKSKIIAKNFCNKQRTTCKRRRVYSVSIGKICIIDSFYIKQFQMS